MDEDLVRRIDDFQMCIEERDGAAAALLLAEDYVLEFVHPARAEMPRARWLEVLPDYVVHAYATQERTIAVDGDCATVLQRVLMSATVLGEDRSGLFVISDVWRQRQGEWRLWRRHSTPLAAGNLPGA